MCFDKAGSIEHKAIDYTQNFFNELLLNKIHPIAAKSFSEVSY